jgi:hypothetical protein
VLKWLSGKRPSSTVQVLKHAQAMRVIFFYPGEEGTYVDHATVTLFENGVVHIRASNEETTTHIQHCEILWKFEPIDKNPSGKLRVLNFKNRNSESKESTPIL